MADEIPTDVNAGDATAELRPCAFCGNPIHPSSHLCTHCGGHVGLAWGTVHKELFLFLFLAVMVIAGCLASWTGRTPAMSLAQQGKAREAAEESARQETIRRRTEVQKENDKLVLEGKPPKPVPEAVVPVILESDIKTWDTVEPAGREINGLDTIRGALMLALAAYGVIAGIFNILHRRLVMWPFVISGMLALWVGLSGIISASKSSAWERWNTWGSHRAMDEQMLAKFRAVPPGFVLLAIAGIILLVKLLGGILAAASKGKPGGDAADKDAARRRKKDEESASPSPDKGAAGAAGSAGSTPAK